LVLRLLVVATWGYNVATMTKVSIRELKDHLSEYIDRASKGEEIAVTKRGKVVATVKPAPVAEETLEQKLDRLVAAGVILRRGRGPLVPPKRRIKLRGEGPSISEMILADRGEPIP
jgi:prevent-host-death family protein